MFPTETIKPISTQTRVLADHPAANELLSNQLEDYRRFGQLLMWQSMYGEIPPLEFLNAASDFLIQRADFRRHC